MSFPQEQVAWLLANRQRIFRYLFIPQAIAALLFLGFSFVTGRVHTHLLVRGERTTGTIVGLKPVRMQTYSRNSSTTFEHTIYEPLVEFNAGDRVVRFQEWKGSASNSGIGWSVPVIYDPADPSFAMLDRGFSNWLPWAPCFLIGLIVALASLKGLFVFLLQRNSGSAPDVQPTDA